MIKILVFWKGNVTGINNVQGQRISPGLKLTLPLYSAVTAIVFVCSGVTAIVFVYSRSTAFFLVNSGVTEFILVYSGVPSFVLV